MESETVSSQSVVFRIFGVNYSDIPIISSFIINFSVK